MNQFLIFAGWFTIGAYTTAYGYGWYTEKFKFNPMGAILNIILVSLWILLIEVLL